MRKMQKVDIVSPFFMPQSKILHLLSSLSPWEIQRLRKFIASPYFNADEKQIHLLACLLKAEEVDRERLHHQVYPQLPYQYSRITNLMSDLTRLIETFLSIENYQADQSKARIPLLAVAQERKLDKSFHALSREIEGNLTPLGQADEKRFYDQFLLEKQRNLFFISQGQRQADESLPNSILALDRFYVAAMLKAICQLLNRQNVTSEEGNEVRDIQESFITYMREHHQRYAEIPLIQGYYLILMTLVEPGHTQHFEALISFLQDLALPKDERKPIYQYAQNYCIKQINRGQQSYLASLFSLYQDMIEKELIYYQGHISPADVKNIVALGLRLREFAWTEAFLDQFEHKIAEEYRANSVIYNRAYLYYGQGKRRAALRMLNQVEFEDVFYYLGAKTLLLKIYYELQDQEGLEALLHAFEATLRRHKMISAYRKKPYLNLIRFTRKLAALRVKAITHTPKAYQKAKARLIEQIQSNPEIANIDWLEEQLREKSDER